MADIDSAAWYDRNTALYNHATQSADIRHLYDRFLARIPAGGRILDAGCGSGRDSVAFEALGFEVTSLDASIEMVKHASQRLSRPTLQLRHQDIDFDRAFDGVWSMASLLHVPHRELPMVLTKYGKAVVPGGILFASFKHGAGEVVIRGRHFSNFNHESFADLLSRTKGLALIESFVSLDTRAGRETEEWFNVLCLREDET